jgi:hypothetical protein
MVDQALGVLALGSNRGLFERPGWSVRGSSSYESGSETLFALSSIVIRVSTGEAKG